MGSTPRSPSPASRVTVRWMEVTTLTPRLSARCSTSAQLTGPEVSPSTASSAPTELSSTRTTSSATGGSTSTAPLPRSSTASMTSTLLRETLYPEPLAMPRRTMPPPLLMTPMLLLLLSTPLRELDAGLDVRDPQAATAGEEDSKQSPLEASHCLKHISRLCISSQCSVLYSAIIY